MPNQRKLPDTTKSSCAPLCTPTDVSLRDYLEAAIEAQQQQISKSEADVERRLAAISTALHAAHDQQHELLPRSEYHVIHDALVSRVQKLETALATSNARMSGAMALWVIIAGLAGFIATLVATAMFFVHR